MTQMPSQVLIAGGGIVGLTIANGLHRAGIPFKILERDTDDTRHHGWSLTLHWCLDALRSTIGPEKAYMLHKTVVDSSLGPDEGNFLFLNAGTCGIQYRIPPSKPRLRLHRKKLRDLLANGLDSHICQGKAVVGIDEMAAGQGVRAHLSDGSIIEGSLIIGADGAHSQIRRFLLPNNHHLTPVPVHLIGVTRRLTPEQAAPIRALDPLLFQALHPDTGNYLWYSIQESKLITHDAAPPSSPDGDDRDNAPYLDCQVIVSWLARDPVKDALPSNARDQISAMKSRAADFAEPLRSLVMDIPDNDDDRFPVVPLHLKDFLLERGEEDKRARWWWDNRSGRVTLAGDAAHAMTMYRGEGANHGILDAALLVDELRRVYKGEQELPEAVDAYETEMVPRGMKAVVMSREAAVGAHDWEGIVNGTSAVLKPRLGPVSADRYSI